MCGIAGFVEFKSPKLGLNDLLAMRRAIQHRGPDDEGFFLKPKVGLAHARLAILDLSSCAHQPMHRGHLTIVYNGEVYNFKELRHDLEREGHQFQSRSDTEVVLASYQRWGKDALSRLNGMFAFAIYDHERNQLFLARDRFGIKPLFYYVDENCLLFASEIKAFYQYHRFRKELCMEAVRTYLHFGYMQGKKTVWKRCFRILPSECILVDIENKKIESNCYWVPRIQPQLQYTHFQDTVKAVHKTLIEEFHNAMVSDVDVGACISGGTDSNILISIIRKELGLKVKTFSLGSKGAKYDENCLASAVAKYLGTNHTELVIDPDSVRAIFLDTIRHYDEPMADQNFISFRWIARKARESGVYVLLSGAGGDELFLGYPGVFLREKIANFYKIPSFIRQAIPKTFFSFSNSLYKGIQLLQQRGSLAAISSISGGCFYDDEVSAILLAEEKGEKDESYFQGLFNLQKDSTMRIGERIMLCDLFSFLSHDILAISDFSTMQEAVEMRVPYLNKEVVELALKIPFNVKYYQGTLKTILKTIEQKYLPERLLTKRKQSFHPFVKREWLNKNNGFKDLGDHYLSEERINKQGLFNYKVFGDICAHAKRSKVNHYNKIWNMLIFQIWADSHL